AVPEPGHRLMDARATFTHGKGAEGLRAQFVDVADRVRDPEIRRLERAPCIFGFDVARGNGSHLAVAKHPPGLKTFGPHRYGARAERERGTEADGEPLRGVLRRRVDGTPRPIADARSV